MRADAESYVAHSLRAEGFDASEDGTGRGTPLVPVAFQTGNLRRGAGAEPSTEVFPTLKSDHGRGISDQHPCVAFSSKDFGADAQFNVAPTMRAMNSVEANQNAGGQLAVAGRWGVRRLTPRECERLQGFPDDYTLIPWRKGIAPDGPRYKALGNSMAVNVMRWIGQRIQMVEDMNLSAKAAAE